MRDRINWQAKINQLLNNKRSKSYINTFATVLFILFMSLAGIIPAISSLTNQYTENEKRVVLINDLNTKLDGLKKLLGESESKSDLLNYFDSIFPEDINQDDIVKLILNLSRESSVDIESFSFEELSNNDRVTIGTLLGDNVKAIKLNLTGNGGQTAVLDFLRRIESSALILDIKQMFVDKIIDNNSLNVTYTFNISTFYFYYSRDIVNE